jgi:hypothetical protein
VKNLCPCQKSNPDFFVHPINSLVATMTEISWFPIIVKSFKICVLINTDGVINSRRMTQMEHVAQMRVQ